MMVSIITPSYNQGKFIERTLLSVASQTGANIEHVIFDGGSTDGTIEILKHFRPAVRWISQKDEGQTDAVNQGIRSTNGEIIGWLNSDDIYYPGTIECVVEYFDTHPEVDVVYGMADHIDQYDQCLEPYPTEPWNYERLQEICFICQPALFFRRHVVWQHGLLNESLAYCMDYEYWLRLGKAGVKFGYLQEKLAGSRLYPETKTLGSRVKVHREINNMFKQIYGMVPDRWLLNYAHAVVERQPCKNQKLIFAFQVGLVSLFSSVLWNRRISQSMGQTIYSWFLN